MSLTSSPASLAWQYSTASTANVLPRPWVTNGHVNEPLLAVRLVCVLGTKRRHFLRACGKVKSVGDGRKGVLLIELALGRMRGAIRRHFLRMGDDRCWGVTPRAKPGNFLRVCGQMGDW